MTRTIYLYRYVFLLIVLHAIVAVAFFALFHATPKLETSSAYMQYSAHFAVILFFGALLIQAFKLLLQKHPKPTRELVQISRNWFARDSNGIHSIVTYLLFILSIYIFGTVKSTLPQIVPFKFDVLFYRFDQFIFGTDPYVLLVPYLGGDWMLLILNTAYQLWLLMVVASILWVTLSRDHLLRLQYLLASVLSLAISGNLLAVMFSSAGPCFFEPLLGLDYYAPLFNHLYEVNERTGTVWALFGQRILWESYANSEGIISGISAMPSMHNVFAWLWVFAAWKNRPLRIVFLVYAILIFLGSVVLGWHYAVDGIAGFALAIPAWLLARPLARASLRGTELTAVSRTSGTYAAPGLQSGSS
ncbi:phosphatase PAP2 family protein [Roseibium sp.]|uniref:phosphatase PAP2 family protein n=1 Tax=Roseibium sp. TaxID=1936156 RepID=UPI003D12827E